VVGRPWILVLAGRDPTGGAGVDADREAAHASGVEARCVVTADTRQDGRRVEAVLPRPSDVWLREARELLAGRPAAIKTGLLADAEQVETARELIAGARAAAAELPVVVDPLLAASGGERFLDAAGTEALLERLAPLGAVLTPNLPEAAELAGLELARLERDPLARVAAARALLERGAAAVCLKGGHAPGDEVRDLVLARGAAPAWIARRRSAGGRLHGSGCRYASALAAGLARGLALERAAASAGALVARLIGERGARAPGA
jgi:hydroxymethylpyrimidine/phosphomethylpyrimidine kinase